MTRIEELTEKLDELYNAFEEFENSNTGNEEIEQIIEEIEIYFRSSTESKRSRNINSRIRRSYTSDAKRTRILQRWRYRN